MTQRYGNKRRTQADRKAALHQMLAWRDNLDFDANQIVSMCRSYGVSEPEFLRLVAEAKAKRRAA